MAARRHYDRYPLVIVPDVVPGSALQGWPMVAARIASDLADKGDKRIATVDLYPGVDRDEVVQELVRTMPDLVVVDPADAMVEPADMEALLARFLTDDRVFGYMAPFRMTEFFDAGRLEKLRQRVAGPGKSRMAVVGIGAALVTEGDVLIFADLPRWEIQLRYRAGLSNWTTENPKEDFLRKYKRAYFIEWRVADRHKMTIFDSADFFLDTTVRNDPKLVDGRVMRAALESVTRRPFRVKPFFDPGVWGGQWLRRNFDLPKEAPNYAWGFDGVPEENSLLLGFGTITVEVPSLNVVLRHPDALLGPRVHARFGAEFPIRFDFLDTIEGGNLSLQVHPTTDYARQTFGISYTQDESYYILEAGPDAAVYLGLKSGIDAAEFFDAIEQAQTGGPPLDVDRFVNRWPAKKHDHFSIPAGTVHCSGSDCVVLEISATPYIFTFKLWDWGRLGLDGRPRPVHLEHGRRVLQRERETVWVEQTTLHLTQDVDEGDGWREERTGLHELEFIETRRHWFDKPVTHRTAGSVHVLNLVEGDAATIESPTGAFETATVNFAETIIIPAAVGEYRVVPVAEDQPHATIRASVRL